MSGLFGSRETFLEEGVSRGPSWEGVFLSAFGISERWDALMAPRFS
ncbi:MAG: hypothetical protein MPK06_03030 [Alphaproteobacteria bacterium]|nr:hypothetical protein [Alphaproteobacteria bacterium]MDA8005500.1 hypothetical protein [Alphaproteobacteria bacterium]